MTLTELSAQIFKKKSFLCFGLDTDLRKLPLTIRNTKEAVFEFNNAIIDAVAPFAVACKINTAFYEAFGAKGWLWLEKNLLYLKTEYPELYVIADAKRADIGNTAAQYARAFFEYLDFDAVTLNPYMGLEVVDPFLKYPSKSVILLALTSNKGAEDFQLKKLFNQEALFECVIKKTLAHAQNDRVLFVAGATRSDHLKKIRKLAPEHFLLVPGVGAQGGDLGLVCEAGINIKGGLLINSSRAIIYASSGNNFDAAAAQVAENMQKQMAPFIRSSKMQ